MQLSLSCDVGVAKEATAALLNMATSEEEKREMGQRGAVDTLLCQFSPFLSLTLLRCAVSPSQRWCCKHPPIPPSSPSH